MERNGGMDYEARAEGTPPRGKRGRGFKMCHRVTLPESHKPCAVLKDTR